MAAFSSSTFQPHCNLAARAAHSRPFCIDPFASAGMHDASAPRNSYIEALEESVRDAATGDRASDLIDVMHGFHRLPPELLPCILEHLRYRQGELARASLVCREWARISKPVSAEQT